MSNLRKIERALRVTCTRCGSCCIEPVPPVTDSDVRRLVEHTELPAAKVVRFYSSAEFDYDADREGWVRFSYGRRIMGLRRPRGRCLFLDRDNHCTTYDARPMTCRTFPYDVELDESGRIAGLDIIRQSWCRRTRGSGPDPERLRLDARRETIEDELFFRRVERWNQNPAGDKDDFLRFLGLD